MFMPNTAMTANKELVAFLIGSNILVKSQGFAVLQAWVRIPAQPLTSCVILGFSFLTGKMCVGGIVLTPYLCVGIRENTCDTRCLIPGCSKCTTDDAHCHDYYHYS